jgi:hypothetical protein
MVVQSIAGPASPMQGGAPQGRTLLGAGARPGGIVSSPQGYAAGSGPRPRNPAPGGGVAPVTIAAYLAQLATLARELAAEASGRCDAGAIRLVRQRLTQWLEDVRSVGADPYLASIVEGLIKRLSAALAVPAGLAAEAIAIADELAARASGSPPPNKPSRLAFWK